MNKIEEYFRNIGCEYEYVMIDVFAYNKLEVTSYEN